MNKNYSYQTSGIKGGVLVLISFQQTPKKNGWALISSIPLIPNLLWGSESNFFIKSIAAGVKNTSDGITKFFFLFVKF